jgi:ABC-type Na+ efflux pump permease subunit
MAFLLVLSVFLTCAGALTIAPERERRTWESLVASPYGVAAIVRAKLVARVLRCAVLALILTPFFIAWAFEVLCINETGPGDPGSRYYHARMSIYLAWLGLRLIGHVLPFVSLGVLISSSCRRARTALVAAIVVVMGYVALIWGMSSVPLPESVQHALSGIAGYVIIWPFTPADWQSFEPNSLVSHYWWRDAIGDVVWMMVIPLIAYALSVRRCKRLVAHQAGS